jgi:hypothetical protein
MGSSLDLRASDAERDHAVDLLRHHATAGRITVEELDERCTAALGARTRGELAERSAERLVFTYAHRPAWTYAVAAGLFPFGLVALLHTAQERIVLDFDRARGGATRLVVTGRAPRSVRRAFAELEAG